MRLPPGQRDQDMLGHELQQRLVVLAETVGDVVALHHDRPAHHAIGDHRHAQPIRAPRPVFAVVLLETEGLAQRARWSQRRPAAADDPQGQAVADLRGRVFPLRIHRAVVLLVGEVDEAQAFAFAVVQRDVEIARVHQLADHVVDAPQHVRHLEAGGGEVGHPVKRGLHADGFLQLQSGEALVLQFQRRADARGNEGEEALPAGCGGVRAILVRPVHGQRHGAGRALQVESRSSPARHPARMQRQQLHRRVVGFGRCVGAGRGCLQPQVAQAEGRRRFARGDSLDAFETRGGKQRRYEVAARSDA